MDEKSRSGPPTAPEVEACLRSIRSDLEIRVRQQLVGGFSGAQVFLVDSRVDGEARLGVVKVHQAQKLGSEALGEERARAGWLAPLLPERFEHIGPIQGEWSASFSTLAKDRVEDCLQLTGVLQESFEYGVTVLKALGRA